MDMWMPGVIRVGIYDVLVAQNQALALIISAGQKNQDVVIAVPTLMLVVLDVRIARPGLWGRAAEFFYGG
jgi:hypothetical protein